MKTSGIEMGHSFSSVWYDLHSQERTSISSWGQIKYITCSLYGTYIEFDIYGECHVPCTYKNNLFRSFLSTFCLRMVLYGLLQGAIVTAYQIFKYVLFFCDNLSFLLYAYSDPYYSPE